MGSFKEGMHPSVVDDFPLDESPYGVRGLGGNSRDWNMNDPGETYRKWRSLRGGAWNNSSGHSRAANRYGSVPADVAYIFGFRLGLSLRSS